MNIEQAINYLKSSGMSDEQIIVVADALTKGAISQLRAEIENDWQLKKYPSSPFSCGLRRAIDIIDKYTSESEETNGTL